MYIQFNGTEKKYNLRNLTYNHITNGSLVKELSIDFDETDMNLADTIADLEALVDTGIDEVLAVNDAGIEVYNTQKHFKIESLQDSVNQDGRRDINLRLIQAL